MSWISLKTNKSISKILSPIEYPRMLWTIFNTRFVSITKTKSRATTRVHDVVVTNFATTTSTYDLVENEFKN